MQTWILLLQGINVSGQKRMAMPDLQSMLAGLGLINPRTYIQSGNAVFSSPVSNRSDLSRRIEAGIVDRFGFETPVFLRLAEDFARVIRVNPFLIGRQVDPGYLHVTFLSKPLTDHDRAGLTPPPSTTDEFQPGIEEIYLFCPEGYGRTKLNNPFFERKLKMRVTTRNWNTVLTLHRMALEI
jgi:uncharacterized protein (DUF1697 family)